MRLGDLIYNLDGLPFRNFELAQRMAELLSCETGDTYAARALAQDGFVVIGPEHNRWPRHVSGADQPAPENNGHYSPSNPNANAGNLVDSRQPVDYELHPAIFRTNLKALLIMAICVFVVFFPGEILTYCLQLVNQSPLAIGSGWPAARLVFRGTGAVLLAFMSLALFWQWAAAVYRITEFGVEARLGIIAHQTISLRFQDIRSSSVKQSITDRLLNIGLIEFASAGTDGLPVQFRNVANPGNVMRRVKARMGQSSVD